MTAVLDTLQAFGASFSATLAIAAVCAWLGLYTVLRRIVFTGVALAQLAAAGVGFGFWAAGSALLPAGARAAAALWGPALGPLLFSLLGAFGLRSRPGRHGAMPDAFVGLAWVAGAALSLLFVWRSPAGMIELRNIVAGDVLLSSTMELLLLWLGLALVAVLLLVYRRPFQLVSFDPEFARVIGVPERRHQLLLLGSLAVAVALSLRVAGLLLVFAFLVVPALTGLALGRRMGEATRCAMACGLVGTAGGFLAAIDRDLPVAPTIAAVMIGIWILARLAGGVAALRRAASWTLQLAAVGAIALGVWATPFMASGASGAMGGHGHTHGPTGGAPRGPTREEVWRAAATELAAAPDAAVRAAAARRLADPELRDLRSVPLLVAAVRDDEDEVASAALEALDVFLDGGIWGARRELDRLRSEGSPEDGYGVALALLRLGEVDAVGQLVALLDADLPTFVRAEVLELLLAASGGRAFGDDAASSAARGDEAISSWQAWWGATGAAGLRFDPDRRVFVPAR